MISEKTQYNQEAFFPVAYCLLPIPCLRKSVQKSKRIPISSMVKNKRSRSHFL
ncbi:hypothetical protein [Nostoc sp. CALU 546]|uniref:hypothetical protein n=1 Tax=Nostoc sp. CALU 546 TaxID=1867241 RepID=UPI003B681F88